MFSLFARRSSRFVPAVRIARASAVYISRPLSSTPVNLAPAPEVATDEGLKSVKELFSLQGKNFVITGGGRGIGYAITRAIAEVGGNVAVLDALEKPVPGFDGLAGEFGVKSEYIRADITQEKSLTDAFDQSVSALGSIDGCVTAAGIVLDKPFLEHGWAETARIQNVNVLGTYFSTQLAAAQMVKQGTGGSIVMIASICAHHALPGQRLSAYNASKGAVKTLSAALSVELAPYQIRINAISPGFIETPMTELIKEQRPHMIKIMTEAPPLRRMGTRSDLVGAAIYLLSDAAAYTTGAELLVTGGMHAGRIE